MRHCTCLRRESNLGPLERTTVRHPARYQKSNSACEKTLIIRYTSFDAKETSRQVSGCVRASCGHGSDPALLPHNIQQCVLLPQTDPFVSLHSVHSITSQAIIYMHNYIEIWIVQARRDQPFQDTEQSTVQQTERERYRCSRSVRAI